MRAHRLRRTAAKAVEARRRRVEENFILRGPGTPMQFGSSG